VNFLAFCRWLANTPLGVTMRDSTWDFAIVEIGHLLAMAIFGGAVLLMDLRCLGLGFRNQPAGQVARELLPLTGGGVVVMLVSGILLVANGPVRYYYNPAFRIKMVLFVVAIFVHFLFQIAIARKSAQREKEPSWLKLAAACSLLLWLSIGIAGRAIGYV
jgi:uncharacterized membrane protein